MQQHKHMLSVRRRVGTGMAERTTNIIIIVFMQPPRTT